ncbi:MAG TPA: amidohydrolase [Gammaproteobacteria bacterium]|nr:amidohydrolase [Gammaproteobacteria bacterium]
MNKLTGLAAGLCLATAVDVHAADDELRSDIAADYRDRLGALFEHFHRNPELSGKEVETSKRLAAEIRALGYDVTENVGGHGIVAVLRNGAGPTVLLRADMDGLPVEEKSGVPYTSTVRQTDITGAEQPVMHACGHDVHITALIGTARQLAARKSEWSGTLVLIGQPSEERANGARDMLADGLYTRFPKPDYALGFHVWATAAAGTIMVPQRIAMSSADTVDIAVHGVGTHGAYPHRGVDPILVASQIVVSLQSLVSRTIDPLEAGVVTVGTIHGGTKSNIIGDRVDLQLTVRADNYETRAKLLDGIKRVADGVARSLGVPEDKLPDVTVSKTETTPPTLNDEPTAARIQSVFRETFGDARVPPNRREGMGGEDFAYYGAPDQGVKSVFFFVGGTSAAEVANAAAHHSALFKIAPEPSITTGIEAMVVGALTLFGTH